MNTLKERTELKFDEAEKHFKNGGNVFFEDAHSSIRINKNLKDNFGDAVTEWYMFNHWGNSKPKLTFFTEAP